MAFARLLARDFVRGAIAIAPAANPMRTAKTANAPTPMSPLLSARVHRMLPSAAAKSLSLCGHCTTMICSVHRAMWFVVSEHREFKGPLRVARHATEQSSAANVGSRVETNSRREIDEAVGPTYPLILKRRSE